MRRDSFLPKNIPVLWPECYNGTQLNKQWPFMSYVGGAAMRRDISSNPHSSALRAHRVSLPGHIYHLVKCLDPGLHRQVDLTNPAYAEIITNALFHQSDREEGRLFAFVIMPDHIHWLFALPEQETLTDTVKRMSSWCAM